MSLDTLRKANLKTISENPSTITATRIRKRPDGYGGFIEDPPLQLPVFTGRCVPSRRQARKVTTEAGNLSEAPWILIAPHDADVLEGDTFEAIGKRFRIGRVIPRRFMSQVFSYHADLEELG